VKNIRITFLALLVLLLSSACSDQALPGNDIENFVEEGLSWVSLRSTRIAGTETDVSDIKIPSEEKITVEIKLNNPKNLVIYLSVLPDNPAWVIAGEPDLIDNRTALVSLTPTVSAERQDLRFTLEFQSDIPGKDIPDQYFSIRCDSPPPPPATIVGGIDDTTDRGMIAFRLPLLDFPDDDIVAAELSWRDIFLTGSSFSDPVNVSLAQLRGPLPAGVDNPLGGDDPLNCYWRPAQVPAGRAIVFNVRLVDADGQISSLVTGASETLVCRLTYHANGGTGVPPGDETPDYGAVVTVGSGESLTRTDYWFKGWNTRADGTGIFYEPGETLTVTEQAITLYAVWSDEARVTAALVIDDFRQALTLSGSGDNLTVFVGDELTLGPAAGSPLDAGTDWQWSLNGDNAGNAKTLRVNTQVPGNQLIGVTVRLNGIIYSGSIRVTVTVPAQYTLGYHANGGSGTCPPDVTHFGSGPQTVGSGDELSRYGYTFGGWSADSNGSGPVYQSGDQITPGAANMILYAVWVDL
jgi:hypothetical protein